MKKLLTKVSVSEMEFDRRYQRNVKEKEVKEISENLSDEHLGVITVSLRKDGKYYVIDGQHRVLAIIKKGLVDKEIDCEVYVGLTPEEEAEMFSKRNISRGPVTAVERFKADLFRKEPKALEIKSIAERNGFRLNLDNHNQYDNDIRAIGALERVYKWGEAELEHTLQLLRKLWGGEKESLRAQFIVATAVFNRKYKGEYKEDRLVSKLSVVPITKITREAKAITELDGTHASTAIAIVYWKYYNKNLKKGKLPNLFI